MKIKVHLSIGYPTACRKGVIDIPDEDLEGLNDDEREEHLSKVAQDWANNYIVCSWDEIE